MSKDKNFESFKQKGPVKAFFCGLAKEIERKASDIKNWAKTDGKELAKDPSFVMLTEGISGSLVSAAGIVARNNDVAVFGYGMAVFAMADGFTTLMTGKPILQNVVEAPKNINNFVHKMVKHSRS